MAAQYRPFRINYYYPAATALLWMVLMAWINADVLLFNADEALLLSAINSLLLAASVTLAFNALRFYRPPIDPFILVAGSAAFLSGGVLWMESGLISALVSDQGSLYGWNQLWWFRFALALCVNSGALLLGLHWNQLSHEHNIAEKLTDTERLAREAELFKLRHQLQPHFLFNSLNSINALITADPNQARKMVQQLSAFLRGSIGTDDKAFLSFSEELDQMELYLSIERVRFGHRLSVEVEVSYESKVAQLPPLLIQPLMENAIKFGLYGTTGPVNIQLSASIHKGYLEVTITNPIDGESQAEKGTGFGLTSVHRRLFLIFGRNDLLTTRQTENQFSAHLRIPQKA